MVSLRELLGVIGAHEWRAKGIPVAALGARIPALVESALRLPEARWSNYTPGLAIASSRHETQYTRLFRS